jgi:hypothetical protein
MKEDARGDALIHPRNAVSKDPPRIKDRLTMITRAPCLDVNAASLARLRLQLDV